MIWANPEILVCTPQAPKLAGVLAKSVSNSELSEYSNFQAILLRGVWICNPFLCISGNSTHAHFGGIDIIIIYMYI